MNKKIIAFILEQTTASVCCVDGDGAPKCFSCFYAFNSEEGLLYYKSAASSNHSISIKKNPFVAGTVLPDKLNKLVVKGIQFEGFVLDAVHPEAQKASQYYHKKHPMALAIPGDMWTIQINHIKMTDSTIGFGKKCEWYRS